MRVTTFKKVSKLLNLIKRIPPITRGIREWTIFRQKVFLYRLIL